MSPPYISYILTLFFNGINIEYLTNYGLDILTT